MEEHESAAADVAGERVGDSERESGGHRGVDGVAAPLQDFQAGPGREVVAGHDHPLLGFHGCALGEQRSRPRENEGNGQKGDSQAQRDIPP